MKNWNFAPLVFALLLIFAIFVSANPPNLETPDFAFSVKPESPNPAKTEKSNIANPGIATFAEQHIMAFATGGTGNSTGLTATVTHTTAADAAQPPSRYTGQHTAYTQRPQRTGLYTPNLDEDAIGTPTDADATYQDTVYRTAEARASTNAEA